MRHPVTLENKEAIKAKWGMPKGHGNQLEGNSTGQRWGTLNTEQKKKGKDQDFPGGPVVKTAGFHCRGRRVSLWFRELRSHMPHGFYFNQVKD